MHLWTDAELVALEQEFGPEPDGRPTAAEAIEEEGRELARKVGEFDRLCSELGLPAVRTLGQLLDFAITASLLTERADGSIWISPTARLPAEVLALTEDEQVLQAQIRWRTIFEPAAQRVIALFGPVSESPIDHIDVSIRELGESLALDPETIRAAIALLLEDGDFSTPVDVSHVGPEERFRLAVDWDRFAQHRIGVSDGGPEDP